MFSLFILATVCGVIGASLEAWFYDQERKADQ